MDRLLPSKTKFIFHLFLQQSGYTYYWKISFNPWMDDRYFAKAFCIIAKLFFFFTEDFLSTCTYFSASCTIAHLDHAGVMYVSMAACDIMTMCMWHRDYAGAQLSPNNRKCLNKEPVRKKIKKLSGGLILFYSLKQSLVFSIHFKVLDYFLRINHFHCYFW